MITNTHMGPFIFSAKSLLSPCRPVFGGLGEAALSSLLFYRFSPMSPLKSAIPVFSHMSWLYLWGWECESATLCPVSPDYFKSFSVSEEHHF